MKTLYWLPVAALAGMIVGAWGSREELNAYKSLGKSAEGSAATSKKPSGFDAFAHMVQIPDAASRRPRRQPRAQPEIAATNSVAAARQPGTNEAVRAKSPRPPRPRDLGARIDEARDLWSTRVDLARAQWKAKLKLSGDSEAAFDQALQEMNERLYDSVSALAEIIDEQGKLSPETGLRLVGDTTTIMAEAYDRIGACVAPELRDTVADINMVDFIDPGVAEPLVGVQDRIEEAGERARGGRR